MPKITLIDYTGAGHPDPLYAARLLVLTKSTRLNLSPTLWQDILAWSEPDVLKEIAYMSNTIPSSWEFADVTFLVERVSRACAQQITRTRWTPMESDMFGSYAMQSQRVTDMSDVTWDKREPADDTDKAFAVADIFNASMGDSIGDYVELIQRGVPPEEARAVLPIGVHCNLIVKYNLRVFSEMARSRDSVRVQGEFASVVAQMRQAVYSVWPWAEVFAETPQAKAAKIIHDQAALAMQSGNTGLARELAKASDILKKG